MTAVKLKNRAAYHKVHSDRTGASVAASQGDGAGAVLSFDDVRVRYSGSTAPPQMRMAARARTGGVSGYGGVVQRMRTAKGKATSERSRKADTLAKNKEAGRAFEQVAFNEFRQRAEDAVEQITVQSHSCKRTRLDAIGHVNGKVVIQEYKASSTAPFTANQTAAFPEIERHGATVVGRGKGSFPGGYLIPPTKVEVIRQNK